MSIEYSLIRPIFKLQIEEMNIHVIACGYELDGKIIKCPLVPGFGGHEFA